MKRASFSCLHGNERSGICDDEAQGLPVWGLTTQQCDVLYLSLEDTQRRIKDRLYNLTDTAPSNLFFAVMCGLIGGGLEEQITDFLNDHPKTKLVIIDTLQKVRDTKGGAGKRECTETITMTFPLSRRLPTNTTSPFFSFTICES